MEFTIDCRTCPVARSSACDDCVVTFVTSRQPNDAVVIDAAEFSAIRRLMAAGLVTDMSAFGPDGGPDLREVS
ncbi:MAG: hypothetical protein AAF962_20240 [Actinomycetota bacterium]